MAYETFLRQATRLSIPAITITSYGRINLNKSVIKLFESLEVAQVLLLWDADACKMALHPSKKDKRTYNISYKSKSTGIGFSAKTFFDYCGIDFSTTHRLPAVWNEAHKLLEVDIPHHLIRSAKEKLNEKVS